MLLLLAEPNQPIPQQKEQPENNTQVGDVNFQETMMRVMLEMSNQIGETRKEIEDSNKKMDELKQSHEGWSKNMEEKLEENSKKMEETLSCLLYTSCEPIMWF